MLLFNYKNYLYINYNENAGLTSIFQVTNDTLMPLHNQNWRDKKNPYNGKHEDQKP